VTSSQADAERFGALYRAHYSEIVRFVYRRTDPATAEQVIAETFEIAWRRLDEVPARALPWLAIVARNVLRGERRVAEYRRGHSRFSDVEPGPPSGTVSNPDLATQAFGALPEVQQEALRLTAWDGFNTRHAAQVAGVTWVVFALRLLRARRRLGAELHALDRAPQAHAATHQPQEQAA
jgi:RNA polymerase sigma-70 factor (ECF subfamily)